MGARARPSSAVRCRPARRRATPTHDLPAERTFALSRPRSARRPLLLAGVLATVVATGGGALAADDATGRARSHYEAGLELFYARDHAQALIEFQRAHETKPRPATVFMMAQCEYFLGMLTRARDHYDEYLRQSPTGEFVEVAKDRIESINRRPATLVINTVPDEVDVRVVAQGAAAGTSPAASGLAPNNFSVPRGRWVVRVSKMNHLPQERTVEVEVAETRPLFFKLDPIPARLEVVTTPRGATLYINGNRARNPYGQDVSPGRYEIFAEATDHESRTEELQLGPGERRIFTGNSAFRLRYVQRSGRPELLGASALLGGLVGAGAVAAGIGNELETPEVSSVSFMIGGALTGGVAGALIANSIVPGYVPDSRALFVIGGMWIGVAEGALSGMVIRQAMADPVRDATVGEYSPRPPLSSELRAAFIGSLPGLAVGVTAGALFSDKAPTYGRVTLIQSAAAGGAIVGALGSVALRLKPFGWEQPGTIQTDGECKGGGTGNVGPCIAPAAYSLLDLAVPTLVGLNVGLAAGLLGAYLPDQSRYGPSWKRIVLIDLAAGAGALAGGIGACVADPECLNKDGGEGESKARARAAAFALLGAGVGLGAGIFLTRHVDDGPAPSTSQAPSSLTLLPPLPMPTAGGGMVSAMGVF
jgi:hypothetical protein